MGGHSKSSIFLCSQILQLIFFRFVAEIRTERPLLLPAGDIANYTELIDVHKNFNPITGVFSLENDAEKGTYVFLLSGLKGGKDKERGYLQVFKNNQRVNGIYEENTMHLQINSVFAFNLQKGDEVKLYNDKINSIEISNGRPFTFTGYKI